MILGFRSRRETRAVLDLQIDVVAKQNQIMEMPPPQQGLPTSQEQNFESLPLSHLKQALQAAGSFSSMEAEVETPPLVLLSSEPPNQKEVHEVINVDGDEESADTAIDVVEPSNIKKGKAVMNVPDGDLNGYSKSKKNQFGSQLKGSNANFSVGLEPPKFTMILGANKNMKSPLLSSNTTNFNSSSQLADASSHFGVKLHQSLLQAREKQTVSSSSYPSIPPSVSGSSAHPSLAKKIYFLNKFTSPPPTTPSSFIKLVSPSVYTLPDEDGDGQLPQNPSTDHPNETEDVLRRFEKFKHFDTVQDHSDHQYSKYDSAAVQPSNSLAKRIQEEWRILESDLPDNIFVRVYETRIDLLRAVIVGAEGTPYHDGLYFFDVFLPPGYPESPPSVYYHSRGLRLNPNLYSNGKVCLSLLNTWRGEMNENWMPGVSTILQVLVSIQGLILNAKPYFNEPGYKRSEGTARGEKLSLKYNEDIFILSLRTMTYVINKPPKHFEDFVMGHFFKRAQDILTACKTYIKGAQVGSLTKGGEQNADEDGQPSQFRQTVAGYIRILTRAFVKIGVKDCQELLTYSLPPSSPPPPPPAEQETGRKADGVTENQASSMS